MRGALPGPRANWGCAHCTAHPQHISIAPPQVAHATREGLRRLGRGYPPQAFPIRREPSLGARPMRGALPGPRANWGRAHCMARPQHTSIAPPQVAYATRGEEAFGEGLPSPSLFSIKHTKHHAR